MFYLTTELSRWTPPIALHAELADYQDLVIDGRLYRRCTPPYYAYLRRQMEKVRTAYTQGSVHEQTYQALAHRFNAVHADAVSLFGERTLTDAVRTFDARRYVPPTQGQLLSALLPTPPTMIAPSDETTQALAGYSTGANRAQVAPVATNVAECSAPPSVAVGARVRGIHGDWVGTVTAIAPPDELFPAGWVEMVTEAGTTGQTDLRIITDLSGQPLVPMASPPAMPASVTQDIPFPTDDLLPPPHRYPPSGDFRFTHEVSLLAVLTVDFIRDDAITLGWSEASLYQNRSDLAFPCGQEYGLVCFLHRDQQIGRITPEAIELLPASSSTDAPRRFYRPTPRTNQETTHA
ncbi:MAG: hypothetical protein ACYDBB_08745 [Armatimonadota bacterium]